MSVVTPILKKFGANTPSKGVQKVHFESKLGKIENFITSLSQKENEKSMKELFEVLLSPLTEDDELESILLQLREHVLLFEKENDIIVPFLLKISWSGRSENVASAYQNLILNLVSAHTCYLSPILQMLVSHFLPKRNEKIKDENPTDAEKYIYTNVHVILSGIIQIVPSSPSVLLQILQSKFPYMQKEAYLNVAYIFNLLAICRYAGDIRHQILELIVSKLLQLDVNCSPQDIADAEEKAEKQEEIFDMESEETVETTDICESEAMKHPLANTLDCSMRLMFEFVHSICHPSGDLNWEDTKKLYKDLLAIFDKLILPTFGCAHVQYIMFYVIGFRPLLFEGFLDFLWKKVQNPNSASIIRQAAVSYISSLLARANYISIRTLIACFDIMCPWIHCYINNQEGTSKVLVDAQVHGAFYAVCQAVFYVFAFRHKELTDSHKGVEYLRSLNFERIVTSRLNPLKICQQVVVKNFASISRKFQLAYCFTIIERNNRHYIPIVNNSAAGERSYPSTQLATFFPFDPYLLSRSNKYISPIYREYEGHVELEETKLIEDEDDFLDDQDHVMSPQTPKEINGLDDYFSYKLSPGFRHIVSPKH